MGFIILILTFESIIMSNTYAKYCPNVFLAKCDQLYKRGDIIPVTTKYGKDNDSIVFNLIFERDGFYYYSIVREDGFNVQEWAKKRAEKLENSATNAAKRSSNWYEKSNEGADFLVLGEPIKIGHHSEKRHRALIERNHARMDNCVKESSKAEDYQRRAEYWNNRTEIINLSMPESIEYFEFKLEEVKKHHAGLKNGSIERDHSMSLQYANKAVKDTQKNYEIALKLWGDVAEDIPPNLPQVETVENNTIENEIISDTYEIYANESHSHLEVANDSHSHLKTHSNHGLLEPTPPPLKIITPHDWQQRTIDRINQVQSPTTNKLLVSAPTGSGKAFLLMFIIQSMLECNKRVLLLVDRCKLVNQLCESANQFGFTYNVIMGNIKQFDDKLLTIASIQTFYKLPHPPQFDVILVDECHTLYKSVINHINQHNGLVIGCTATPVTAGLKRHYPTLINEITQLELEQQKILTPLRIEEKRYIDMDSAPINSMGEWDAREIVTRCQVGFDNWIVDNIVESLTQHNHALAFCASIDHCKQLQIRLNNHGIKSAIYTSQQDTKEREDILTKYESGLTQVLITVATLSKGFDCKIIDLIIDLRPLRNSLAEYVQMQGRGTRINEGKNTCTVLDFTGNWQRFKQSIQDMRINGVKSVYELTWTELDEIVSTQGVTRRKAEYIAFAATDDGKAINERISKNQDTILELERLINLEKIKSKAKNPIPPPPIVKSSMWDKVKQFIGIK